jgi:cytochrome c oxidase subunit 3
VRAPTLGEPFADLEGQNRTLEFGMWVFLASELLLFAALFTLYASYRTMYLGDFKAAVHANTFAYGTTNMYVLLTSSLFAALAVWAARIDRPRLTGLLLVATALLGVAFLIIKLAEYAEHVRQGSLPGPWYHDELHPTFGANRFYTMYWGMTGFHALHVTAGVCVVSWMAVHAFRGRYTALDHAKLEMGTLYWHLVDLIWIFLWPILYLS